MKKPLCLVPWRSFSHTTDGFVRLCCKAHPSTMKLKGDVGQILDSSYFREAREKMLLDQLPKECERCRLDEAVGIESMRQKFNEEFGLVDYDGEVKLKHLDLKLGSDCNLKCRMCLPNCSSAIAREGIIPSKKSPDWSWLTHDFLQTLLSQLSEVEFVNLTGGEPSVSPMALKLLADLIDSGRSLDAHLSLTTNLNIMSAQFVDKLSQFKSVSVTGSIDGFGKINDYIRFPSTWTRVKKNLLFLRDHPVIEMNVNTTIQWYNILYLKDLVEFFDESEIGDVDFTFVINPDYLDIRRLPENVKQMAVERLQCISSDRFKEQVNSVISFMEEDLSCGESLKKFKEICSQLDKKRGQSLIEVAPELAQALNY